MFFDRVLTFFLCWIIPLQGFAFSLEQLNGFHQIPTYSFNSTSELKKLYDISQNFVSSKENVNLMNTSKGKLLKANQRKLRNFLEIKKAFSKCMDDRKKSGKEVRQSYYARIINASGSVNQIQISCRTENEKFLTLNEFSKHISKISKTIELEEIQQKIFLQSLKNTVKTYIHLRKKTNRDSSTNLVMEKICPNSRCDNANELEIFIKNYQGEIKSVQGVPENEIVDEINNKINFFNTQLKEVKAGVEKGWFNNLLWDSSDPTFDEAAEQAYSNYEEAYIQSASNGFGKLLMTKHLRGKVGHLKSKEDDISEISDRNKNTTKYTYPEHKLVEKSDIRLAVDDALKTMEKQSFRLNLMNNILISEKAELNNPSVQINSFDKSSIMTQDRFNNNRLRDIKRLVKTNPAATGELLMNYPELSATVCEALGLIQDEDDNEEFWDNTFFWGGVVVGGLLLGGGLVVMGGMLLARGAAATAFYSSLGTGLTAGGLVTGTVEALYWTDEVLESQMSITSSQMAFISGLSDTESIKEVKVAMEELNESIFNLSLSLGFTAIDVAAMYSIIKASRFSKASSINGKNLAKLRLLKMKIIMDKILSDTKLTGQFSNLTNSLGKKKTAQFIALLGNLTEKTLAKTLSSIKSSSDGKFSNFAEKSLLTLKGCS